MEFHRDVALDNAGDAGNVITTRSTTLHRLYVHNNHASTVAFIHLYKTGTHANVTPGTTVPDATYAVEASVQGVQIDVGVHSANGWTICGSDAAAGSGSAVSTVEVTAVYG